jgi:transcriptional regulator with XRE-family HTH domain
MKIQLFRVIAGEFMKKAGKSKFDLAVIERVKKIREAKGFSQDQLAFFLDTTPGYIGQVESPKTRSKYNLNHLNRLALEMKCSPRDFLPEEPFAETIKSGRRKQKK